MYKRLVFLLVLTVLAVVSLTSPDRILSQDDNGSTATETLTELPVSTTVPYESPTPEASISTSTPLPISTVTATIDSPTQPAIPTATSTLELTPPSATSTVDVSPSPSATATFAEQIAPTITQTEAAVGQPPIPTPLSIQNSLDSFQTLNVFEREVIRLEAANSSEFIQHIATASSNTNITYVIGLQSQSLYELDIQNGPIFVRGNVVVDGKGSTLKPMLNQQSSLLFVQPNSSLTLYNVIIEDVGGSDNGYNSGALITAGDLNIYSSTLRRNSARSGGGAVDVTSFGIFSAINVIFENNTTSGWGGAIYLLYGQSVTVTCSTFSNNSAILDGGAVYLGNNFILGNINNTNFYNNIITNPLGTIGYGGIYNGASNIYNATQNFWNPTVTTNVGSPNSVFGTNVASLSSVPFNLNCPVPPIPTPTGGGSTLADYGIELDGNWTPTEQSEILQAVEDIASAFVSQLGGGDTVAVFRDKFGIDTRGNIRFVRVSSGQVICIVNNNSVPRTVTCGNLVDSDDMPRPITKYVIVHELGHVFNNQADQNNATSLLEYVQSTSTGVPLLQNLSTTLVDDRGWIMGSFFKSECSATSNPSELGWRRGERGWGSGPGSTYIPSTGFTDKCVTYDKKVFSDFQQNPGPYDTDIEAFDETAADMFLNWIYREINQGGFLNRSWKPDDPDPNSSSFCNQITSGCISNYNPGEVRYNWMEIVMSEILGR